MKVLAIRHHVEDNPGLIGAALEVRGFTVDLVLFGPGRTLPTLDGYDMVLLLGSKESVYDEAVRDAWFNDELALLSDADARNIPVFGICFGAQALCTWSGGTVAKAAESEIGWTEVTSTYEGLSSGSWFEFHYDACALPTSATVWATSPRAVQAFAVGRHVGVQFHPEIDEAQLRDWLDADPSDVRHFEQTPEALLAATKAMEPDLRQRAQALVDLVLAHNGLAQRELA